MRMCRSGPAYAGPLLLGTERRRCRLCREGVLRRMEFLGEGTILGAVRRFLSGIVIFTLRIRTPNNSLDYELSIQDIRRACAGAAVGRLQQAGAEAQHRFLSRGRYGVARLLRRLRRGGLPAQFALSYAEHAATRRTRHAADERLRESRVVAHAHDADDGHACLACADHRLHDGCPGRAERRVAPSRSAGERCADPSRLEL